MAEPSLRDRIAPYAPYWPWVVVPALILALALLANQTSSQGRKLELMRGDLHALEQQVANLKRARNTATPLLSGLQTQQPRATPAARTAKARTSGTAPRTRPAGATAGKTGKRARRTPPAPEQAPAVE